MPNAKAEDFVLFKINKVIYFPFSQDSKIAKKLIEKKSLRLHLVGKYDFSICDLWQCDLLPLP